MLKTLTFFFLKLVVLYGALVIPWPGLAQAYLSLYRAAGEAVFGQMGSGGAVHFEGKYIPNREWATTLILRSRNTPSATGIDIKSRYGYLTILLTLSLIVATPVPWSRKWKAVVWGAALAMLFVLFCLWLVLVDAFSDPPLSLYSLSGLSKSAVRQSAEMLALSPEATFVVPIFMWIVVTLRRADLERFAQLCRMSSPPLEKNSIRESRG